MEEKQKLIPQIKVGDIIKLSDFDINTRSTNRDMVDHKGQYLKVTYINTCEDYFSRPYVNGDYFPIKEENDYWHWNWFEDHIDHICTDEEIETINRDLEENHIFNGKEVEKCELCNTYHYATNITTHNNIKYCENCFNFHFVKCANCGKIESRDTNPFRPYNSRSFLCDDCINTLLDTEEIFFCEGHERYEDDDGDTRWTPSEERVCAHYFSDHCTYCEHCGEAIYYDDAYYDDDDDYAYCEHCWNNIESENCYSKVCNYHSRVKTKFGRVVEGKIVYDDFAPDFKGYGIELEVDTADTDLEDYRNDIVTEISDMTNRAFYYQEDGSLSDDGIEIISHPHTKEALDLLPLEEMCKMLIRNGLRGHQAGHCGLHVHISRKLFGDTEEEQDNNILKMVQFYHSNWDDVVKFSRRKNFSYCSKLPCSTDEQLKAFVDKKGENYGRYTAINLTNKRADTVEVRIMRSTLNSHTLRATLDFVDHIAKRSLTIADEDIKDPAKWLDGISDRCKDYMKIRGCFGYTLDTLNEEV